MLKFFYFFNAFLLFWLGMGAEELQHKILFQHIPKSGGVTVSSLLMNEYHYNEIINPIPENIKLYAYGYHFSLYELMKKINISDFKLITFIRNPIDRILSEHRYCIGKHKGNPQILKSHRLPIHGDPIYTASNVVCKMLSGIRDYKFTSIEKHLELAKKALVNRYFFIGITEKTEESIHLLYSSLNWKIPEEIPHFNATESSDSFSKEILNGIAERNWADIELYEYALTLYEQQKNQIAAQNNIYEFNPEFVKNYYYTFDQKLQGYGWGIREVSPELNLVYRWVNESNKAGIDFYLQSNIDYSFQSKMYIQPIFLPQLSIFVNDIALPLSSDNFSHYDPKKYCWVTCTANIPKNLLKNGEKTRIVFKMTAPQDPELIKFYKEDDQQQNISTNYIRGKFGCQEILILQE